MKVFRRKAIILCLGYILLLVLTMLNLMDKWHKEPQQCNEQVRYTPYQTRSDICYLYRISPPKKQQLVYVFTTWHSGSSFGEFCNQNPDFFFLYEPVWQKLYPGDAMSLQGAAQDLFSSLYQCDLSTLQLYNTAGAKNISTLEIFGASTKVICSSPKSLYKKVLQLRPAEFM